MNTRSRAKRSILDFLNESGLAFLARAVSNVAKESRVLGLHWVSRLRARKHRGERNLRLNFGCGPNIKQGWINIDLGPSSDLQLDLRKLLPFDSNCCAQTYSEHFFEHLDFPDDALRFLTECFRVTGPGGTISVGVPDAGAVLMLYAQNHADSKSARLAWHTPWVETWMGRVNWLFRQNYAYYAPEHRFAYDFITLEHLLGGVGFIEIRKREFDPSLDSENRKGSTLYVEGRKPEI